MFGPGDDDYLHDDVEEINESNTSYHEDFHYDDESKYDSDDYVDYED